MGNLYSTLSEFKEISKTQEGQDAESKTPILSTSSEVQTPISGNNVKHLKPLGLVDPRSPSQGVSRTPLEIEERNKRIEKTRINNFLNKENNMEPVTTPTGPPSKDLLSVFDPRSPNPEISRTPIALKTNTPVNRKVFQS